MKIKSAVEKYYCLEGETYCIKTSLLFSCEVGPFWHLIFFWASNHSTIEGPLCSCFLCEWDSRTRGAHYSRKHWPHRQSLTPGMKNVIHKPLIKPSKVLPPPQHIKLGLMKNFVKALDVKGPAFMFLCGKFPRLIFENVKGVFIGPQIRHLFKTSSLKHC